MQSISGFLLVKKEVEEDPWMTSKMEKFKKPRISRKSLLDGEIRIHGTDNGELMSHHFGSEDAESDDCHNEVGCQPSPKSTFEDSDDDDGSIEELLNFRPFSPTTKRPRNDSISSTRKRPRN